MTHACPKCAAPMNAQRQPALIAGRPDTVLLTCTTYRCYTTIDERDLPFVTAAELDGLGRAQATLAQRQAAWA